MSENNYGASGSSGRGPEAPKKAPKIKPPKPVKYVSSALTPAVRLRISYHTMRARLSDRLTNYKYQPGVAVGISVGVGVGVGVGKYN
ncbi:jg14168 [Pararge aegeria aegeria]|uniref:Jg14168 protein n=1 Tax=Pararge aegeria aegeria TaxID=348720 RepID=A0A8S4QXY9_9NEOP|nr:jg14168 [Pararge aegeria aegeria]